MISIIITAYKEEKIIEKAILSIIENNLKESYEILVLAPDEPTLSIARTLSKKYKQIQTIVDPAQGKPTALNMAFKKAKGDKLILTDGDVYVDKNALKELIAPLEDEKIGAVSGHPVSLNSRKKILGYWSHLLTDIADERRRSAVKNKKRFFCSGYLFSMKAGIFKEIPTETLSDDGYMSYLIQKEGYKLDYAFKAKVYVKFPTNIRDWIAQKKRSAGGYNQIKYWTKEEMRSFSKESLGALAFFKYANSLKGLIWLFSLFLTRIYLWALIFRDINLKKKSFNKVWVRVESTKN